MEKTCVLIEHIDWKREVVYSDDRIDPNFWIKQWYFVNLTTEKIDEIERATIDRVQEILNTL